jgi:serine phosphatase RsbU (regulator of sigma subunit)
MTAAPAIPLEVAEYLHGWVLGERPIAWLVVDSAQTLVAAGGALAAHGLDAVQSGRPAPEQLCFLEGLLPPAASPFRLQHVQTTDGRAADLHLFVAGDRVWVVLIDSAAERDAAQRVQQKAYDMTLLSEPEARLIGELEAANLELKRTYAALEESRAELLSTNQRLARELEEAANYVRSILPPPVAGPTLTADWLFIPSTELGGDSFGYHWIDSEHLALYVLDVSGHGVGAALLSAAVANTLRSEALPNTDFRAPDEVLGALNQIYLMEKQNNLFLTIWYGVFHKRTRLLAYASAGHPPALLVPHGARGAAEIKPLRASEPILGALSGIKFAQHECPVPRGARLFLMTDGVFEIKKSDGSMLEFEEFLELLARPVPSEVAELDRLVGALRSLHGPGPLDDDLSIIRFEL